MSGFKVVSVRINNQAFRELRRSPGAKRLVMSAARKIAAASGPGYEAREAPGRDRARAIVVPTTAEARRDSATNLTLLRNLGAAR